MSKLSFAPQPVEFDPRLADALAYGELTLPTTVEAQAACHARRSPFNGYARMLTPEGGILIVYYDQALGLIWTVLRVFTWLVAVGTSGWLIFFQLAAVNASALSAFAALTGFITYIVLRPLLVRHSVEIRPDAMIIDGEDVFYADDMGEHLPELQMKDNDPNQFVIAGICGTRYIEFMTANRLDDNDRTAEILLADLLLAMEQLWGRREVVLPAAW